MSQDGAVIALAVVFGIGMGIYYLWLHPAVLLSITLVVISIVALLVLWGSQNSERAKNRRRDAERARQYKETAREQEAARQAELAKMRPVRLTSEAYISTVAAQSSQLVSDPLPEEFYTPIFAALAAFFKDALAGKVMPNEDIEVDFLAASIKAVVAYSLALRPFIPNYKSAFTRPLAAVLTDQNRTVIITALTKPFKEVRVPGLHLEPYVRNRISFYSDDETPGEREKRWKFEEKLEDELMESMGRQLYTEMTLFDRTPFFPQKHQDAFYKLTNYAVPFLPEDTPRFRHTWAISPTGTGKTNLLENLIERDIQKVMQGQASLVVLDSQKELITHILSSVDPAHDKVVYLEPNPAHPLALNIFDSQAIDYAKSQELADFVLSALATKLTEKQGGLFRFLAKAMQVIPNATVKTLMQLLGEHDAKRPNPHFAEYLPYFAQLDDWSRDYFETRFNSSIFAQTKAEVASRLDIIMSDDMFRTMFTHPRNRLNLAREIDQAKIILVNTNPLTGAGREMLGRFIIAMVDQATENRLAHNPNPMPLYMYVDECHDYIANEPKIAKMMDKARKQRVAMTFAHQRMKNIPEANVLDALANSLVKYAGRLDTDADFVAKRLRLDPDVLTSLPSRPPFKFAMTQGEETVILTSAKSTLVEEEKKEWVTIYRERMIDRYCADTAPLRDPDPIVVPPQPTPPRKSSPRSRRKPADDIDLSPTKS